MHSDAGHQLTYPRFGLLLSIYFDLSRPVTGVYRRLEEWTIELGVYGVAISSVLISGERQS
jgi:hypothetical protein